MTKIFVRYVPERPVDVVPVVGLKIEDATCDDLPAVADLIAQRERNDPERHLQYLTAQIAEGPDSCQIFIVRLISAAPTYTPAPYERLHPAPPAKKLCGSILESQGQSIEFSHCSPSSVGSKPQSTAGGRSAGPCRNKCINM